MSDSPQEEQPKEPKIIVDTDWKEQVQREKEAAQHASPEDTESNAAAAADASTETPSATAGGDEAGQEELPPPPPASFEVLVSMMFTQAMAMLGQMPDPRSGEATVNKLYAKHYIDTLDMLGEKTQGNLSDDESKVLSEALHALRITYVNVKA